VFVIKRQKKMAREFVRVGGLGLEIGITGKIRELGNLP
jgi:hypothetical protein